MSYGTRVQAISQVTDRKPLPSKIPQRLEASGQPMSLP
jgi:glutamine synthetase